LLTRVRGAVGKGDPIRRGGELQLILEIIIDRRLFVTAACGEKNGAGSCKEQITLTHKLLFPETGR
jgi:hypothetical protein